MSRPEEVGTPTDQPALGEARIGVSASARAPGSVTIVGAGLMGTSLGLALREEGVEVWLDDRQSGRVALAAQLGAGRPLEPGVRADIAVAAVPPAKTAEVLLALQRKDLSVTFTDLASAKSQPQVDGEKLGLDFARYVGGHPLAGRERSGPAAARADLFVGRPWVLTPTPQSADDAIEHVEALARSVGAVPVVMTAQAHDEAVAVTSHLPHLFSTLLAGQLTGVPGDVVGIAGPGLQDMTRLAEGDPDLWTGILRANATPVAAALARLAQDLNSTVTLLEGVASEDPAAIESLRAILRNGVEGRRRIPGKRGQAAEAFVSVEVIVRDTPGELARLLQAVAAAGVNIEDLRVEHEPGRPLGVAELEVREESVPSLVQALRAGGWAVER